MIVGGNLMVRHDAVEAFGNPIFVSNHDDRLEQYKKLVAAAKAHGSLFISQLSHVGRQGGKALNPTPVSASDVQLQIKWGGNEFAKPRALEVDEIKEIVGNFADSAYWCWKAGYDGVQVSHLLLLLFHPRFCPSSLFACQVRTPIMSNVRIWEDFSCRIETP